ncbi:MAG: Asp23/Gls24 family envelope stress response protein [Bacteroidota bacterium]
MPNKTEAASQQQLGTINISPNTIATVAGIATMQCFGVVGMASRNLQDGISELLTGKDNLTKGIEVVIDEDQVRVDLYIIVEYGVRIQEVARNVIENVRYAIENQLGLDLLKINVIVQSVRSNKK